MYVEMNLNPKASRVGDCAVRAVAMATGQDWERVYTALCAKGLELCDMPSSNYVLGAYLQERGFSRSVIPNNCPSCYSVKRFAKEHPHGRYVLITSGHAVAVVDGCYYDSWDSGEEIPAYYWKG